MLTSVRVEFREIPFELEPASGGGYLAFNDDLRVVAHGETEAAAQARFKAGLRELIRYCAEQGLPLPGGLRTPA